MWEKVEGEERQLMSCTGFTVLIVNLQGRGKEKKRQRSRERNRERKREKKIEKYREIERQNRRKEGRGIDIYEKGKLMDHRKYIRDHWVKEDK